MNDIDELLPNKFDDDLEKKKKDVRTTSFTVTCKNKKGENVEVPVVWDKDIHRIAIDIDVFLEDADCDLATYHPVLEKALRESFEERRKDVEATHNQQKKYIDGLTPEMQKSLNETRFFKFYGQAEGHEIRGFINKLINRYIGDASACYPDIPDVCLCLFLL